MMQRFLNWFLPQSRHKTVRSTPPTRKTIKENTAKLEIHRRLFENDLIGSWVSAEGTFFMMYEKVEFLADGTGSKLFQSGRGYHREQIEWRPVSPYVIEMRTISIDTDMNQDIEDDIADDPEEEWPWYRVSYEFKMAQNDICTEIYLCSQGRDTFDDCVTRITYEGAMNSGELIMNNGCLLMLFWLILIENYIL